MNSSDYDIVICGAGPTGSALALLLARHAPDPARIALTGKQFHTDAPAALAKPIDPRTLAMNQGSRVLLEQLGAWPAQPAGGWGGCGGARRPTRREAPGRANSSTPTCRRRGPNRPTRAHWP